MDVQRGKGPESVERPISIEFKREEVLELFASFVSRKLNAKVKFTSLKSGTDSTTIVLSGGEIVPLVWGGATPNTQPIQPVQPVPVPAGKPQTEPEPEHSPEASPKPFVS